MDEPRSVSPANLARMWTQLKHEIPFHSEIFDLVSALEAAEGPKTNFYSFMNVSPTATTAEIAKTYRKRSLVSSEESFRRNTNAHAWSDAIQELHPDRGGDPERFARLGVISGILRDAERRKQYVLMYLC